MPTIRPSAPRLDTSRTHLSSNKKPPAAPFKKSVTPWATPDGRKFNKTEYSSTATPPMFTPTDWEPNAASVGNGEDAFQHSPKSIPNLKPKP